MNVKEQFKYFNWLLQLGYIPFAPLTSHFIHMMFPQDYMTWINWDLKWVETCDILLRLPGQSKGADMEVEHAKKNNIPVVYSVAELRDNYPTK